MIQRIQSVWLFLTSLFSAITFKFPFYTGDWLKDALPNFIVDLNAQTTVWLTIVTVITGALALVNIFLFRNRKLQLRLCYFGILLSLLLLALYVLEMMNFEDGTIALWVIFYVGILVGFIFATRGISKDEKLIKSMDRLR